jgi:hypothetical protein
MNLLASILAFIKRLFVRLLHKPGTEETAPVEKERVHGTTGLVHAPALWLHEDRNIVLLVDYDFEDFPSWVEWDRTTRKLFVVQMGGAAAELPLEVPANENMPARDIHRLLLVTGKHERRNAHFVSFIVRD